MSSGNSLMNSVKDKCVDGLQLVDVEEVPSFQSDRRMLQKAQAKTIHIGTNAPSADSKGLQTQIFLVIV